jgi:hypothetical protein
LFEPQVTHKIHQGLLTESSERTFVPCAEPKKTHSDPEFRSAPSLTFEPIPENIVVQFNRTDVAAIGNVRDATSRFVE